MQNCVFPNIMYHAQEQYNQRFLSSTSLNIRASQLLFVHLVLDGVHPDGRPGRQQVGWAELESVLLIAHLLETFYTPGEITPGFGMGTRSTLNSYLLASKQFMIVHCKADEFCFTKSSSFSFEMFVRKVNNIESSISE